MFCVYIRVSHILTVMLVIYSHDPICYSDCAGYGAGLLGSGWWQRAPRLCVLAAGAGAHGASALGYHSAGGHLRFARFFKFGIFRGNLYIYI